MLNRRAEEAQRANHCRRVGTLLALALLAAAAVSACASRNALLNIVTSCIDVAAPGYCEQCLSPRINSSCAQGRGCTETTEVWEETKEYVVIRDRKMCGCPADFVHGLVIPRSPVTGVEDPRKPAGIWRFAWDAARKRIHEESEIALAVNPPDRRTQDQLHIHIARLKGNARSDFSNTRSAKIQSLYDAWQVAAKIAETAKLKNYGVLVARDGDDGYIVAVDRASTEKTFTQGICR